MKLKVHYSKDDEAYILRVGDGVDIYMTEDEAQFLMDELDWALNPREISK